MSNDKITIGFGVEGVQFTDYPQLHHLDKSAGIPAEQPKSVEHIPGTPYFRARTAQILNQDQLDQIGKHFGLKKFDVFDTSTHVVYAQKTPTSVNTGVPGEPKDDFSHMFLPVRNGQGYVKFGDRIWWRSANGPRHILATHHEGAWHNIARHPALHQFTKPLWDEKSHDYLD